MLRSHPIMKNKIIVVYYKIIVVYNKQIVYNNLIYFFINDFGKHRNITEF
jgi:hypothetical protein